MCVIIQGTTCVDLWHCSHVSRGTIAAVVLSSFFSPHILILIISPFAHRLRLSPLFNSSLFFFRPLRFFVLLSGSRILLSHQQLFLPTLFSPPWTAFQCSFFPLVCNLSLHNSRWLPRFSQDIH